MSRRYNLLIDDPPLMVLPRLALAIGLDEAIFLQQLHWALQLPDRPLEDGLLWVYNTYEEWQRYFPFWSTDTIKRTVLKLEKRGLVITRAFKQKEWDRRKWYTIDYDAFDVLQDAINDGVAPLAKRSKRLPSEQGKLPPSTVAKRPTRKTHTAPILKEAKTPTERGINNITEEARACMENTLRLFGKEAE